MNPDGSVPETEVRAVVLESGFRHLFNVKAGEWIALMGGNVVKTADFLQSLNAGLDQQLNSYANIKTFQVMFEEN